MSDTIDVVSFAVPYPPIYGGVIDVFYRLKALHSMGIRIKLHAFIYADSQPAPQLEQICSSIEYYDRSRSLKALSHKAPFIQASRQSDDLIRKLAKGNGPVLYEGLHTIGSIDHPSLRHRKAYVRMHNIEWQYYQGLANAASFGPWKWYYNQESKKLQQAERAALIPAHGIFAISQSDRDYYSETFDNVHYLPPFHPYDSVDVKPGSGDYILYQGDLSLRDNAVSALRVARICEKLDLPCVVAGRSPSDKFRRKLEKLANTRLYFDVSNEQLYRIMQDAHIHVIESSIAAGFKLKLLASLFTGRFVVTRQTLLDEGLEEVTTAFNKLDQLPDILRKLDAREFGEDQLTRRKEVILPRYSNEQNARLLWQIIGE